MSAVNRCLRAGAVGAWLVLSCGLAASPAFGGDGAPRSDPTVPDAVDDGPDRSGRIRLGAPLGPPRDSFFHAPLLMPRFMGASVGVPGRPTLRITTAHTKSIRSEVIDGKANRFDGLFHEWLRLDLVWPVTERVELLVATRIAGWDERRDVFRVYSGGPYPSVEGEEAKFRYDKKTGRHDNLADVTLGAKIELWRGESDLTAVGLAALVKVPVAREPDLSNAGTIDLSLVGLASVEVFRDLVLHANLGVTYPLGDQTIFEDDEVEASPFAHATVGVTWLATDWMALGAGIDAATSPWGDVPLLDEPTVLAFVGTRFVKGGGELELGVGTGLTDGSPDWAFWVGFGYTFGEEKERVLEAGGRRSWLDRLLGR